MSIATRTGDKGETSLLFGRRASKADSRVCAYGAVDELNAGLGLLRARVNEDGVIGLNEVLEKLQKMLVTLMGELATHEEDSEKYDKAGFGHIQEEDLGFVDSLVAEIESRELKFEGWVMPGGTMAAAFSDQARTICRRAEREIVMIGKSGVEVNPITLKFLNRMSDYLWLLARDLERVEQK